jgi:hypothetical protein
MILGVALGVAVAVGTVAAFAGEQADWGKVVCIGSADEAAILLIENDRGMRTLIVDPYGEVESHAKAPTTLAKIKPGDHVDFAVSAWAGMQIADLAVVTPHSQAKLANAR